MGRATITIRLDSADRDFISDYAATLGLSGTEFMRTAALERIEDELDLKA